MRRTQRETERYRADTHERDTHQRDRDKESPNRERQRERRRRRGRGQVGSIWPTATSSHPPLPHSPFHVGFLTEPLSCEAHTPQGLCMAVPSAWNFLLLISRVCLLSSFRTSLSVPSSMRPSLPTLFIPVNSSPHWQPQSLFLTLFFSCCHLLHGIFYLFAYCLVSSHVI